MNSDAHAALALMESAAMSLFLRGLITVAQRVEIETSVAVLRRELT